MEDVPRNNGTTQVRPIPPPKPVSAALVLTTLKDLTTRLSHLEEKHAQLAREHTQLQDDHNDLQSENRKWQQKVAELKVYLEAFQADHSKVLTKQGSMEREINSIRAEQLTQTQSSQRRHTEIHTLQSDLSQMKADSNKLQTEVTQIQADHKNMTTRQNNMKTEMTSLQTVQAQLTADMDRIKTDQKTFKDDVINLQKDHVDTVEVEQRQLQQNQDTLTSDVDMIETDVEVLKTSLEESLRKASSDITALEITLEQARQLFDVGGLDKDRTRRGQAMIFTTERVNEAGYFLEDAGIFRAPHAGLYFFTATVASGAKDASVYGHIMVDGVWHCVVHGGHGGGSGCAMVPLTAGQHVWVMADSPVDQYLADKTWFSGTLVMAVPW